VTIRLVAARRDMRHFLPDPLDEALVGRLLGAAHLAPSVGLMQPWRFVRIRDPDLRCKIHALVEAERINTARALAEREDEFMRLKVEGILECGELLVAALTHNREHHVFGRRTMPENAKAVPRRTMFPIRHRLKDAYCRFERSRS
jgi:5,6-dimethylbenzimidazole synthase